MMDDLAVHVDESQVRELQEMLQAWPRLAGTVMSRALNKIGAGARSKIVKAIAGVVKLTQSRLRKHFVRFRRATRGRWLSRISTSGWQLPLEAFTPRQTRRGLSYSVYRKEGRQTIRGAFLAKGKRAAMRMPEEEWGVGWSHVSLSYAKGREGLAKVGRLPLWFLMVESPAEIMRRLPELAAETFTGEIGKRLADEIRRQIEVVLRQKAAKAVVAAEGGE